VESRVRWKHLHEFQQGLAQMQSVYCLTIHRSQGSTFQTAFLELPDIRRREKTNLLEAQEMLYVAITRPSHRLIVLGSDPSPRHPPSRTQRSQKVQKRGFFHVISGVECGLYHLVSMSWLRCRNAQEEAKSLMSRASSLDSPS